MRPVSDHALTKRTVCDRCRRPLNTCLCALITAAATATEVVIWQHPSEADHPKGSARLLHLCLPNSRIVVGEQGSAQWLGVDPFRCALLYPDSPTGTATAPTAVEQLLLLDGTWRKSRKMFYLNPWLAELPRLPLGRHTSAYRIRKAETQYQLSTFEAAVLALQTLEPEADLKPLKGVFTEFVAGMARFRPPG